ncbi:DUF5590 domain-containing protein [Virgibacillus sp. C22-A2]|uniref:DUF5590 domain-containing protein n=1 Tax=Virgibacillus tibetensis TaxID=3042313 RepID=A0ABU6KBG7_9BACI|nr:DUF5590 domain-containing protein [Virgibacillus sp. C22-A2]
MKYLRYTGFNWFKWSLLIISLIAIVCFIAGIFLYLDLKESKYAGQDQTAEQILRATSITEIDKIEQFNGAEAYHVIFGKNDKNEEKIIFYPLEGNEKNLTTIDQSEIVTEQSVLQQIQQACTNCELIKILPALVNDEVLWEITYIDNSSRYVMEYVSIYDGSQYEQYRFRRMFK